MLKRLLLTSLLIALIASVAFATVDGDLDLGTTIAFLIIYWGFYGIVFIATFIPVLIYEFIDNFLERRLRIARHLVFKFLLAWLYLFLLVNLLYFLQINNGSLPFVPYWQFLKEIYSNTAALITMISAPIVFYLLKKIMK